MSTSPVLVKSEAPDSDHSKHSDLDFFSRIPWVERALYGRNYIVRPLSWRTTLGQIPSSETFFGRTLNTPDTFKHFCMLVPGLGNLDATPRTELVALLHLGPDLAGHPGVCHGGVLSTVLDEVMGTLVFHCADDDSPGNVTANLSVDYVKPVAVPGVIMVRAKQEGKERRKTTVSAEIISVLYGTTDEKEVVCSRGKALFIELRK